MLAIYERELKSYFHSMTGCVFIAFLVMFTGIYFMAYNLNAGYPYFSYTLSGSLIVFLVGIPLLTMRSFSEERKTKTDQLLLTAPVSLTKVVLGKYFAMVTVLAVPNVIFCLFPLLIKLQGISSGRLQLHCGILPVGMCVSGNRDVYVVSDREPDHCIYQYVWNFAFVVFVGRNLVFSARLGVQRNDRNPFDPDTDRCLYLSYDEKLDACGRN